MRLSIGGARDTYIFGRSTRAVVSAATWVRWQSREGDGRRQARTRVGGRTQIMIQIIA